MLMLNFFVRRTGITRIQFLSTVVIEALIPCHELTLQKLKLLGENTGMIFILYF